MSRAKGQVFYEVEICCAGDQPRLLVGACGTNYRCDGVSSKQAGNDADRTVRSGDERAVGGSSLSWAVYAGDGDGISTLYTDGDKFHRSDPLFLPQWAAITHPIACRGCRLALNRPMHLLSNRWESFGLEGWLLPGKVLGVALDLDRGTISVCVKDISHDDSQPDAQWSTAFASGVLAGSIRSNKFS